MINSRGVGVIELPAKDANGIEIMRCLLASFRMRGPFSGVSSNLDKVTTLAVVGRLAHSSCICDSLVVLTLLNFFIHDPLRSIALIGVNLSILK